MTITNITVAEWRDYLCVEWPDGAFVEDDCLLVFNRDKWRHVEDSMSLEALYKFNHDDTVNIISGDVYWPVNFADGTGDGLKRIPLADHFFDWKRQEGFRHSIAAAQRYHEEQSVWYRRLWRALRSFWWRVVDQIPAI